MNNERTANGCRCLDGISCEATHCVYNDEKSHCTAPSIKVSSRTASTPGETSCDTFCCR